MLWFVEHIETSHLFGLLEDFKAPGNCEIGQMFENETIPGRHLRFPVTLLVASLRNVYLN